MLLHRYLLVDVLFSNVSILYILLPSIHLQKSWEEVRARLPPKEEEDDD